VKNYPAEFGHSPEYDNPGVTLPLPSPQEMPRPIWFTPKIAIRWGDPEFNQFPPLPPGVTWHYRWSTPAFDLRPDLRSAQAAPKDGQPVWSVGGRLYVQLAGNPAATVPPTPGEQPFLTTAGMTVTAMDWVHTTTNYSSDRRPGEGITGGAGLLNLSPRDVTADFIAVPAAGVQLPTSILAGFAPPGTSLGEGEGNPVRYWRLQLDFFFFIETGLPEPDPLPAPDGHNPSVLWASVY